LLARHQFHIHTNSSTTSKGEINKKVQKSFAKLKNQKENTVAPESINRIRKNTQQLIPQQTQGLKKGIITIL